MWLIIKAKMWPFNAHKESFARYSGSILAIGLGLWSFVALVDRGTSNPLPWIPLLNPLDIMLMIVFITLFKWWQTTSSLNSLNTSLEETKAFTNRKRFNKRVLVSSFVALAFLWLNFTLFRIAHHWFGVSYNEVALYASSLVQTSVSILWAFTGVILTLFASRKNNRLLWVIGAVLLALVVLKLFVIDLSALGSLGRIVSFLVVGALLTSIGYFAPLPDKSEEEAIIESETNNSNSDNKNTLGEQENAS